LLVIDFVLRNLLYACSVYLGSSFNLTLLK